MKKLEVLFETFLWKSRLLVILAVISSLISSLALFIAGFLEIMLPLIKFVGTLDYKMLSKKLVTSAIASIDMFLIATFLLIFALGLYELFVSKIDVIEKDPRSSKVLFITTLEDLKTKLGRVVIMVLIVTFFKRAIDMDYKTPLEILYLSAGALGIALALYFSHKEFHKEAQE